ncbi:MAG TPA: hypothetical protein DEF92_07775 [Leclercia adecarboxylata]|nr:hypothetical protein [Leclercia adecarboxylata]
MSAKEDYFAALQRLKRNQPRVLPKNSLINKDSVALEAGRKRGSIRKNRDMDDLIAAIDVAANHDVHHSQVNLQKKRIEFSTKKKLWKSEKEELVAELNVLRSRNMSLLYQVYLLTKKLHENHIETNVIVNSLDTNDVIIEINKKN